MARNFFGSLFGRKEEGAPPEAPESAPHSDDLHQENAGKSAVSDVADQSELQSIRAQEEAAERKVSSGGMLARLREGLAKTSGRISDGVASIFQKRRLDAATLRDLEDLLITADLGVRTAAAVCEEISRDKFDKEVSELEVKTALARVVERSLQQAERPLTIDRSAKPYVILVAGVNGAGKTTTIGKLAARFRRDGLSCMIAAGDTFRAAAIEQLQAWGRRTGTPVIASAVGADAAGLAFEALEAARSSGADVLFVDTAGRLQNKKELMDELAKIVRVLRKIDPSAPHETLLVLDATVGQNAISQTETFREIAGVSGLVMTKLDGTARGGVLVALTERFGLPVRYVGVGEGVDDLQAFRAATFARALAGLPPQDDPRDR